MKAVIIKKTAKNSLKSFNDGIDIRRLTDELPPGLDRAVLRILSFHVGRRAAISRPELLGALAAVGFQVHERAARATVNQLRKAGNLICSTGGEEGGYWISQDWDELSEYLEREIHARAMDLLEQENALKRAAQERWGPPSQQIGMEI